MLKMKPKMLIVNFIKKVKYYILQKYLKIQEECYLFRFSKYFTKILIVEFPILLQKHQIKQEKKLQFKYLKWKDLKKKNLNFKVNPNKLQS